MKTLFVTFVALVAPLAALAQTKPTPQIEYPKSADYLIAELDGKGGYQIVRMEDFLAGTLPECPGTQVFGDGRAVVCNSGRPLEIRLSEVELTAFIQDLLALSAHELDSEDVAAKKLSDDEDRFQQTGAIIISVDVPTYELKLHLTGYATEAGQALRPIEINLSWHSVSMTAEHYPGNEEVQRLAAIERLFGELSHRIHQTNKRRGGKK